MNKEYIHIENRPDELMNDVCKLAAQGWKVHTFAYINPNCCAALLERDAKEQETVKSELTPLQALQNIKFKLMRSYDGSVGMNGNVMFEKEIPVIETALKRLQEQDAIDVFMANLSKDLRITDSRKEAELIAKQLKALEIINNKNVDTLRIKITPNVTRYNKKKMYGCKNLTKEEYELLKEVLMNDKRRN